MAQDLQWIIEQIKAHELKDEIIEWYIIGPPAEVGFMWCKYDTPAKKYMQNLILSLGYDSSAYGCMHRMVQHAICTRD
nr:hypothetical protein [Allomuricauda sp.]